MLVQLPLVDLRVVQVVAVVSDIVQHHWWILEGRDLVLVFRAVGDVAAWTVGSHGHFSAADREAWRRGNTA